MIVKTVSYQGQNAPQLFCESLQKTGFAIIENHNISNKLIDEVYVKWAAFFKGADKHDFTHDAAAADGYFPFLSENAKGNAQKDLKEFYHYYPWGKAPESLKLLTQDLYDQLLDMGLTLLDWLDQGTPDGLKTDYSQNLSSMTKGGQDSLLRILHYPPVEGELVKAGAIRAAAHEDINLITLLVAGSQPGLEVRDLKGNWHLLRPAANMIIVNAGDMLALASGGYYPSTPHRVINPPLEKGNDEANLGQGLAPALSNVSRYSLPFFIHPKPETRLSPDLTAGEYLQQRLQEIGLKAS